MLASSKLLLQRSQFGREPLVDGLAWNEEFAGLLRLPTDVGETQEVDLFRFGDSFPSTKDGREHAWASATVKHGEHKERLFVGCVGDKIIAYRLKTHWS